MATAFYSRQETLRRTEPLRTQDRTPPGFLPFSYVAPASSEPGNTDYIVCVTMPEDGFLLDIVVIHSAVDTGAIFEVGDAADPNEFCLATSANVLVSQLSAQVDQNALKRGKKILKDSEIRVTYTTEGIDAGATMYGWVQYIPCNPYGDMFDTA